MKLQLLPLMAAAVVAALLVNRSTSIPASLTMTVSLSSALLLYILWSTWVYPFYLSPLRNVPTVPGCPLWGHFFIIITNEVGVPAREWHEKYGGVVRYFFPFGAERLSIADDDGIKQMTVRNPYNYPKPIRAKLWMERILGEGMSRSLGNFARLSCNSTQ